MPTTRLSHYLSKTILVKMTASDPEEPQPFKLNGIEAFGLWLETADRTESKTQRHSSPPRSPRTILVPFAQIEYIVCDGEARGTDLHSSSSHRTEQSGTSKGARHKQR